MKGKSTENSCYLQMAEIQKTQICKRYFLSNGTITLRIKYPTTNFPTKIGLHDLNNVGTL